MRFLRYFTLLVLALLSLNIVAQENDSVKIKVTVIYDFGKDAVDSQYEEAMKKTRLYTFSPNHSAKDGLKFLQKNGIDTKMSGGTFLEEIDLSDARRVSDFTINDYLQREKYAEKNDTSSTVLGRRVDYTVSIIPGATSYVVYCDYDAVEDIDIRGNYFTSSAAIRLHIEVELLPDFIKEGESDDLVIDDKPAEKPGVLIMNKSFVFPYKVRTNQRIVAQPVWYDRVDISDANSDTVFAYGKAVYLDCAEYALTQNRAMDYKMTNDKLYSYTDTAKYYKYPKLNVARFDSLWSVVCNRLRNTSVVPNDNDDLLRVFPDDKRRFSRDAWVSLLDNKTSRDSLQAIYKVYLFSDDAPGSVALAGLLTDSIPTRITLSEGLDTIYVHAYEELRGHDPNTAHPYPQGLQLYVEDYNRVLVEFPEKDGGERKSPFKFLDFSFTEFLPDAEEFHMVMRSEAFEDSSEVRLRFEHNIPKLIPNDSLNEVEKVRLNALFDAYRNDESRNLQGVRIVAYSSPEGDVEDNKELARKRALTAKSIINTTAPVSVDSDVAPWDSVVSLLRRDNKTEMADFVQSAIDRHPGNMREQGSEIIKSSYYKEKLLDDYLAALRTVKFRLKGTTIGQLPDNKIIEKYRDGLYNTFTRAEYWVLLNRLTDRDEHRHAAQLAYKNTCNPIRYTNHKGYWAYAAAHYAAGNIASGIYDLSVLSPFLDMENAMRTVEEDYNDTIVGTRQSSMYELKKPRFATTFVADGADAYKAVLEVFGSKNKDKDVLRISTNDYKNIVTLIDRNAVNGTTFNLLDGENETLDIEDKNDTLWLTRRYKEADKIKRYYKGQRILVSDKKTEKFDVKDNILYLNQIDMVANQLIMTLKNPESYWSQYLDDLVDILKKQMVKYNDEITRRGEKAEYERLLAVANCYIGDYAGSDPESVRLREIVAATSLKNKVIINIAMDDPQIRGGKELNVAYGAAELLPDTCVESNYLRAIILARKNYEDRVEFPIDSAYSRLAKSFHGDISKIYVASNDQDFLSRVAGVDVVNGALLTWEREKKQSVDSIALTTDDLAFLNYKTAIDEPDTEKARLSMYKAFLLDKEYYNVVAVRMKGLQKKLKIKANVQEQSLFDKLKAIRSSYDEAVNSKNADAIYMQALNEVNALKKNNK